MTRFVAAGDVVVVKPNIGFDRTPAHAANTHPAVVAAVVRACLAAGARRVVVTDRPGRDDERSFERSQIGRAASDAGAEVLLSSRDRYELARFGRQRIDEWPVSRAVLESAKLINVPVAKHHSKTTFTGAIKNWFGALGGKRPDLHDQLDLAVGEVAAFFRPQLTVVDATRVLVRNGPWGGNLADVETKETVVASVDQVAADCCACALLGIPSSAVSSLKHAARLGAGTMAWRALPQATV
jgi:uncharacterized protein (DUF362 family)